MARFSEPDTSLDDVCDDSERLSFEARACTGDNTDSEL